MSARTTKGISKKRKRDAIEVPLEDDLPAVASLDIESDEEDRQGSDDGEMDDFPELDMGDSEVSSDSEESEESTEETKISQNPGDLVVSSITGRLKRIYPDIEPNYDSDSSTEDVRVFFSSREYIDRNASRHRIG
jgi:ribosome biogenesis protein ERB1